jgi:hypothetical protein
LNQKQLEQLIADLASQIPDPAAEPVTDDKKEQEEQKQPE